MGQPVEAIVRELREIAARHAGDGFDPGGFCVRCFRTGVHLSDCLNAPIAAQLLESAEALEAQAGEIEQYRAEYADCAPYLKDDEQPAECIERNRKDIDALVAVLGQRTAALETVTQERDSLQRDVAFKDSLIWQSRKSELYRATHAAEQRAKRAEAELTRLACGVTTCAEVRMRGDGIESAIQGGEAMTPTPDAIRQMAEQLREMSMPNGGTFDIHAWIPLARELLRQAADHLDAYTSLRDRWDRLETWLAELEQDEPLHHRTNLVFITAVQAEMTRLEAEGA